jgi:hypothetical protein
VAGKLTFGFSQVTASIILKSMFSSDSIESLHQIRGAVETMIAFVTKRSTGLASPVWVPTAGNRKFLAAQKLVHQSIGGLIAARRAQPSDQWPDDLQKREMQGVLSLAGGLPMLTIAR